MKQKAQNTLQKRSWYILNSYTKTNWVNGSAPALSADNLNKIEDGIEAVTNAEINTEEEIHDARGTYPNLKQRLDNTGAPTDEQVAEAVEEYLEEHPPVGNFETVTRKQETISNQSQTGDNENYPTVKAVRDFVDVKTSDLEDYIDDELDILNAKISSVYKFKGSVATYQDLPSTNLTVGDVYNVESDGSNYAWTGSVWDNLGTDVDLSNYQTKIDASHKLSSDLVDDTNKSNKFVTSSEKTAWGNKYDKPSGGIPKTDLSSAVQTSLGKADSALQPNDVNSKYPVEFTPHAGLIDARDLSIYGNVSLGNYHTSITVEPGEKYIIDCKSSNNVYPGAFYTLNGVKVSAIFDDNATHLNEEITVPSGVDTLWLNNKSTIIPLNQWKVYKILSSPDYCEKNNNHINDLEVNRIDESVESLRRLKNLEGQSNFKWKPFDKAYYCFINDGTKAFLHVYYDIFHSHNKPLVSAAVGENIELMNDTETSGGRTVKETLDAIVADGGEVMTYLNAAELKSTDPYELWYEYAVKNGKRLIESYGYNVRGLILSAQSARNSSIGQEICERFFDYSDRVGTLHSQYDINRRQFSDTSTVADVKAFIDSTVNTPGFYPILFHRPSQDPWATSAGMDEILTHIENKGSLAAISTYSYVFDTFGSNGYLTLDDLPIYDGGVQ